MGYSNDGVVFKAGLEGSLDEVVSTHIHIRGCLVQDEDFVVAEDCSGEADELFLAHREDLGGVRNGGVEFLGELD